MKKFTKILLLALCATLFATSVALLAACKRSEDPNQFVQEQGNTVKAVLDSLKSGVLDYRLKPGSPIPEPGVTKDTTAPTATGFVFAGYYEGTLNDDGTVSYGKKWDFSDKVYEDITLYGKWEVQYRIHFNYLLDGTLSEEDSYFNIGDNAAEITFVSVPSWTGNTFVQLFSDEQCTEPFEVSADKPFAHGCTQQEPVCELYAQFISGSWTLIRQASDLRSVSAGARLYLMNDIDMSSLADEDGYTKMTAPNVFNGVIEGNGHVISNLNYLRQNALGTGAASMYIGLFSQLNGATIRNVTFKDCSVQGRIVNNLPQNYFYAFMAGEAHGDCVFENIVLDNCVLKEMLFGSSFDVEKEKDKIVEGTFVAEGNAYLPTIK